jgi:acetyl esterase/lipase
MAGNKISSPLAPGRLGNPNMRMAEDPRIDPRIAKALKQLPGGMAGTAPTASVDFDSSYESCRAYYDGEEASMLEMSEAMMLGMPDYPDILSTTRSIVGKDGNEIELTINRPAEQSVALPGVVYLHGGGMVILSKNHPPCVSWAKRLAMAGMVVVAVEFRNGAGNLGPNPFPAGLNDCSDATQWVAKNRQELGISQMIVSGESGGGNLSLATALKANAENWVNEIDGVYALCPCVAGDYANAGNTFGSWIENNTYFMSTHNMGSLPKVYDPKQENTDNCLAWPLFAKESDLKGLPPHVISVNELDPLRDEGLAYYRKLTAAGVSAVGRVVCGTPHGADFAMADSIPEIAAATMRDIQGFAAGLEGSK